MIHYFLCILHANENLNHVKAKYVLGAVMARTLQIQLVLYLTDTCIFCEKSMLPCRPEQYFRDAFSTMFSNGFDFPISPKNVYACQEMNALTAFLIFDI